MFLNNKNINLINTEMSLTSSQSYATSLVYVHIGDTVPQCLYHSVYQSILVNGGSTKTYIIVEEQCVNGVKGEINSFNLDVYLKNGDWRSSVHVISLSTLQKQLQSDMAFNDYTKTINNKFGNIGAFRGGFWISTTARFFYIKIFMQLLKLQRVFHIENDIMLYEDLNEVYRKFNKHAEDLAKHNAYSDEMNEIGGSVGSKNTCNKIWTVQDAPDRVVPSILFFPNWESVADLTQFITDQVIQSHVFQNDMNILGKYPNKICLPLFPNWEYQFDGAAIGQYLGGVDLRNVQSGIESNPVARFINNTVGFVNETSIFKPDKYTFTKSVVYPRSSKLGYSVYNCNTKDNTVSRVANLHIHSKELYQFSSVFDLKFVDIITGDRILSLCDYVICTRDIYDFHKGIDRFAKDVILVNDWNNVNTLRLNQIFWEHVSNNRNNGGTIKLFIYTHILRAFADMVLPFLDPNLRFVIYTHNSDHPFDSSYTKLLQSPMIKHVYAQNIDFSLDTTKLTLLPIGIANSMWPHGDIVELYTVMSQTYNKAKTRDIYVNINPNTYGYRRDLLDAIRKTKCWELSQSKPYGDYLRELAQYRFCLCMRGNGLDTHRFWECLYLGVIPVIINNKQTQCKNFIKYLRRLAVPFIELSEDNLEDMCKKYPGSVFNQALYERCLQSTGEPLGNNQSLKLLRYVHMD